MSIFNIFKKKQEEKPQNEKVIEKNIDNLKGLISLALKDEDKIKMTNFVENLLNTDNDIEDETDILNSQEIIDFIYDEEIYLFGFFDWREESIEFHDYIKSALKKNFQLELKNENICDLDELGSIDLVYKIYGEELEKMGITLCCIDTLSDSYTIMLIKNSEYEQFKKYADNFLEFTGKHYTEEW